uniref:GIPC1-3 GH1 domain-containing protein n=1 Tax=Timema douglasi TaxID=61478 RepID=A0A7R8VRC4_TIMDO|nr:unnamed protein product [Timema douglasi]
MPLFTKKPGKKEAADANHQNGDSSETTKQNVANKTNSSSDSTGGDSSIGRPKLVFHCQQAQGSPTGLISGFSNVRELYQKIAECYDFPSEDLAWLTLEDVVSLDGYCPLVSMADTEGVVSLYGYCPRFSMADT